MNKLLTTLLAVPLSIALCFAGEDDLRCVGNNAFTFGEKLVYRVHYGWLTAGVTTFEVMQNPANISGRTCYHIVGKGYSTGAFDWFFKVRDNYETYLDDKALLPMKFIRDVSEGGYTFNNRITFDHFANRSQTLKGTYDVPPGIQDVLSVIYYFRTFNFDSYHVNDTIPVIIFLDNELCRVSIKYLGREVIKTQLGKFNTIKVQPQLISGTVFKEDAKMYVWISDDENKIPIRIESEIIVGSIQADLKEFSGLKNDLSSIIK